jgi:hypothetical protein
MEMKKPIMITLLAAGGLLMSGAGCEIRSGFVEPGVAVGTGYDYDYYPDSQVYFSPRERIYYWRDHDDWRHGNELPAQYDLHREHRVPLHLNTNRPYTMHDQTRTRFPGHAEDHDDHR